jgi:hypothetical protein
VIGQGRLTAFTCLIRPFRDRLDITFPWVFYEVPASNPDGPLTFLTDRFWDFKDHWVPPGVGVVPGTLRKYFGPLPPPTVKPLVGTAAEWANGLLYSKWIAGGYSNPNGCIDVLGQQTVAKVRQAQSVRRQAYPHHLTRQAQMVRSGPTSIGLIRQAQAVAATWEVGVASTCCGGALPLSLLATITGSDSGDGVYPLTFDPTTLAPSWKWDGAMGTCPTHTQAIVMFCPSPGSTMFLAVRRATPTQTPILCTLVSFSCDPVDGLWNLPAGSCPSDSGAGTIAVTPP